MPISVAPQNIHNEEKKVIHPPAGVLNRLLPLVDLKFPLLQYIDEYGNKIFNGNQMAQLLRELEVVAQRATTEEEKQAFQRIRDVALECQAIPHLFVRFIGD